MAIPKAVKVGGAYYKGYKCAVASASGDYSTVIVQTSGIAINGISIVPDQYGAGDTMKLQHMDDASGTGNIVAILAEDMYNQGAYAGVNLDFTALEKVDNGECIKFIYHNTASVAMNVYLIAEFIGLKKTA